MNQREVKPLRFVLLLHAQSTNILYRLRKADSGTEPSILIGKSTCDTKSAQIRCLNLSPHWSAMPRSSKFGHVTGCCCLSPSLACLQNKLWSSCSMVQS
ncbi:hypothetical protein B0T12DRAFT_23787 [Alternaria alternata]|nr:hypothetical protein B0T12DRAFT_23787 [Alternaria alternata]